MLNNLYKYILSKPPIVLEIFDYIDKEYVYIEKDEITNSIYFDYKNEMRNFTLGVVSLNLKRILTAGITDYENAYIRLVSEYRKDVIKGILK